MADSGENLSALNTGADGDFLGIKLLKCMQGMGWRGYSMMVALQEASMKDCIGHAEMLSAAKFVCGACFLNLSIWKQERVSYIITNTQDMQNTYNDIMVNCTKV